jgi:hypothetical protein
MPAAARFHFSPAPARCTYGTIKSANYDYNAINPEINSVLLAKNPSPQTSLSLSLSLSLQI